MAVAVRVPAHYELSKNAIEAGKHVFCEWPLGANTKEAEELAALARQKNVRTMVGLQRRASPAYLYMRELIQQGYVGQVLAVNLTLMNSGVLTRPSDRTWQRDVTLGANTLTITFAHVFDAMCMVVGELTEVSAIVSTQVPQWFETDTKKYVDVTSPDNIVVQGRLENGAIVNAYCGVHPYHGSGHRLEIYGRGRHAVDDRRRRGRRGAPAQTHGRTERRQGAARVACAGAIHLGAGSRAQRWSRIRRGPDVGQVCRRDTHRLDTSSPTSITRCAATERWMPSCALHRPGNGKNFSVGNESRSRCKSFKPFTGSDKKGRRRPGESCSLSLVSFFSGSTCTIDCD